MSQNLDSEKEISGDLSALLAKMLEKWFIFLISAVIMVSGAYIYTKLFTTPKYDSSARILIMNTDTAISTSEISVSSYLTKDYEYLIVDRVVLEQVIKDMNLNMSYSALKSSISIYNPQSTRILEITVRTASAETSKQIVDCICVVAQEKIVELSGVDRVNILGTGSFPGGPSSPNLRQNLIYSFLGGLLAAALIVLIIILRDDKFKRSADIEEQLKIGVLGVIPYNKARSSKAH